MSQNVFKFNISMEGDLNNHQKELLRAKADPQCLNLLKNIEGKLNKLILTCRKCNDDKEKGARAFICGDDPLEIVLCTNRLRPSEVKEALTHELIHAYDYVHKRCNFFDCEGLSFTEIRAAKFAECSGMKIPFLRDRCIKQKAILSTANLFPDEMAKSCVEKMFEAGLKDNEPL